MIGEKFKMSNICEPIVAGVDEVGRGPLAGPVVACAYILGPHSEHLMITDSKLLNDKQRQKRFLPLLQSAQAVAIGSCTPQEIDQLNIHHATLLAMSRAIDALSITPDLIQVDGKFCPPCDIPCEAIIQGDQHKACIGAASIIAKVYRDTLMTNYNAIFPEYGFSQHKGYPTRAHREAIQQHGITPIHRKSFSTIKQHLLSTEATSYEI